MNTTLIAFLTIIASASGSKIRDNFHYCLDVNEINDQVRFVNLEMECERARGLDMKRVNEPVYSNMGSEFNTNNFSLNEISIIQKLPLEVRGEGYECWKTLMKMTSSVNFFGARTEDMTSQSIKLTRAECQLMVTTRKCDNAEMSCDSMQRVRMMVHQNLSIIG